MKDVLVVEELGYPFLKITADHYTLDTKVVMPNKVIQSFSHRQKQYQIFAQVKINNDITTCYELNSIRFIDLDPGPKQTICEPDPVHEK